MTTFKRVEDPRQRELYSVELGAHVYYIRPTGSRRMNWLVVKQDNMSSRYVSYNVVLRHRGGFCTCEGNKRNKCKHVSFVEELCQGQT